MGVATSVLESGLARRNHLVMRILASARRLAARKLACIAAFAIIPLVIRLALLPWIPIPQPGIQDEFSYLLAADTFASGHLTNPPHPLWVFFESVHIIQQPTYMSKYPPLTGLILALGQRVFGQPWIGVLLGMAVLCGVLTWALQEWLPPIWAFAGACVGVLKIGMLSYWSESYWGGAGAAIGGAFLVGSLPRLTRHTKLSAGLPAALGIALLALSRPFEGLVLTVLCLAYAVWRVLRDSTTRAVVLERLSRGLVAPLAIVLIPTGVWMLLYNQRVTGHPFLLPYSVHEQQYAAASAFFWLKPRPMPTYRHEALRREWVDWDLRRKTLERQHFVVAHLNSYTSAASFFWGVPLFLLILVAARDLARSRRTAPVFWLAVLFAAGLGIELEFIPHYAAPATALAFIIAAGALRSLFHRYQGKPGLRAAYFPLALFLVTLLFIQDLFKPEHRFLYDKRSFQSERARILNVLEHVPGKQLVFMRYGPNHDLNHEWVYNRANIDGSQIVWAHSMGPERDRALISYYKDRHVWMVEENGAARILPYAASDQQVTLSDGS